MHSFNTVALLGTLLGALACGGGEATRDQRAAESAPMPATEPEVPDMPTPASHDSPGSFALVEVANPPGTERRKVFRGITFVTDSERLIVSYDGADVYSLFAGRKVRYEGERYEPEHQALSGPHLRPGRVVLVDPSGEDLYLSISAPESVCGEVVSGLHPENTKRAGERFHHFKAGGKTHQIVARELPAAGRYQVSLRRLGLNAAYAPALPVTMAMPIEPVWFDAHSAVAACD